MRWRYVHLIFFCAFVGSWFAFALIWYVLHNVEISWLLYSNINERTRDTWNIRAHTHFKSLPLIESIIGGWSSSTMATWNLTTFLTNRRKPTGRPALSTSTTLPLSSYSGGSSCNHCPPLTQWHFRSLPVLRPNIQLVTEEEWLRRNALRQSLLWAFRWISWSFPTFFLLVLFSMITFRVSVSCGRYDPGLHGGHHI